MQHRLSILYLSLSCILTYISACRSDYDCYSSDYCGNDGYCHSGSSLTTGSIVAIVIVPFFVILLCCCLAAARYRRGYWLRSPYSDPSYGAGGPYAGNQPYYGPGTYNTGGNRGSIFGSFFGGYPQQGPAVPTGQAYGPGAAAAAPAMYNQSNNAAVAEPVQQSAAFPGQAHHINDNYYNNNTTETGAPNRAAPISAEQRSPPPSYAPQVTAH
jgi:hypothetical protein